MFVFHLAKSANFYWFRYFSSSSFVRVRRNWSGNLAIRTAGVEDTHLTLAVIPYQVEANISLIFLPLQTYKKKFA